MSAAMFSAISVWKPTYLPSPMVKASAPDESRVPSVISPLDLIFANVSPAWAKAVPEASAARARAIRFCS